MQSSMIRRKRSRLSPEDATALASYGARTTWPAGFQIYQKGTPADGLSVVLRGHVVLRNRSRSGRAFIPAIATPGETFGIEGIVPEAEYATDACASDEAETLFISGAHFRAFIRENPTQAIQVVGQLMSERAHLLEKLYAMASQNVEQRLVAALQRLGADRSLLDNGGHLVLEPRHHRLMCEMVGATRESVALALSRLVGAGAAERKGSSFVVAPAGLAAHISGSVVESVHALPIAQESMSP